MQNFIEHLKSLTTNKDRHIKGHSLALLKRLQEITDDLDNQRIKNKSDSDFER